jgi:hypothetical protein
MNRVHEGTQALMEPATGLVGGEHRRLAAPYDVLRAADGVEE